MRDAGSVGEQRRQFRSPRPPGGTTPHCSGAGRPQLIVRPGNRITEALLAGRQAERHVHKELAVDRRRDGAFGQQRPPGDVAGIERHHIRRAELAHRRAQAVGANEDIGRSRAAVAEMRDHALPALLKGRKPRGPMITVGGERIAQQAVDALPGGEHLGAFELQRRPASPVQDAARRHGDAEVSGVEAERVEPRDQFGLGDDAGAAAGQLLFDALENIDVPAAAGQHDAGQQPTHRAADDQRAALPGHSTTPPKSWAWPSFPKPQRFSILCL